MARGAVLSVPQMWNLAQRWYDDRLQLGWRRRTQDERQRLLAAVGLHGDFWSLPSDGSQTDPP